MKIGSTVRRDGEQESLWQQGSETAVTPHLSPANHTVYDCLVVGGGITGLTTALLLQEAGKAVVLAEAKNLGFGTTGGTSAHLNTFFDATYADIESDFGKEAARLVADGGKAAFNLIRDMVRKHAIDCDLEIKDAYLFAENEEEVKQLDQILTASKNAGIDVEVTTKNIVTVPSQKALIFKDQGQFHPLKYLYGLARAFQTAGGTILEDTKVTDVNFKDEIYEADTGNDRIRAKSIVYAMHSPPPGINVLDLKCAPYRSYVLALQLEDENYPDGLAYDMQDPYHYIRTHQVDGRKYLVVGGEDHKTGHDDPEAAFKQLEAYAARYYNVAKVAYRWSSQYYIPDDGLPYIGKSPGVKGNTYVATGFNGNGMIFGTLSAMLIRDLICGIENPYKDLYSPSRIKPVAGFMDFVKENTDVAYHFIADRFNFHETGSFKALEPGSGKLLEMDGQKVAAYRDDNGNVHALNPICTHMKCVVNWNAEEKSWDCPCHGARYDIDGKVLTGPATVNLEKLNPEVS